MGLLSETKQKPVKESFLLKNLSSAVPTGELESPAAEAHDKSLRTRLIIETKEVTDHELNENQNDICDSQSFLSNTLVSYDNPNFEKAAGDVILNIPDFSLHGNNEDQVI